MLATGDVFESHSYTNIDVGAGGGIDGVLKAVDVLMNVGDIDTKIVPGHGPLATKADMARYRTMMQTARDRIAILIAQGKSEDDVFDTHPLADLDPVWKGLGPFAAMFPRLVYRSLKRHQ